MKNGLSLKNNTLKYFIGMTEFRILDVIGSCPTNEGETFYCPQVKINNEWKTIHGTNMGNIIRSVQIVSGLESWKNKYMAENVIAFYKQNINE